MSWTALASLLVAVVWIFLVFYERYGHGLSGIPGPLMCSWSNFPKFLAVYRHSIHRWNRRVHHKYGPVVRIGPKHVSFASTDALRAIYACKDALPKGVFYGPDTIAHQPLYQGHRVINLFSLRDVELHNKLKRSLASAYTRAAVEPFERHLNDCVLLMVRKLKTIVKEKPGPLDIASWLHFYSFDSLCAVNISKRFGFLDSGKDINNILQFADDYMAQFALVAQLPRLNRLMQWWSTRKGPALNPFHRYVIQAFEERLKNPSDDRDLLNALLRLRRQRPEEVSYANIIGAIYVNLMAGHDVLAITLRSIFYYLARDSKVQARLRAEILEHSAEYGPTSTIPTRINSSLPYLQAVIYESLRMHPNTGTILERDVPASGMSIDGHWLPGGTTVGCNAWLIHRDQDVFGQDVDTFRPERWLGLSSEKATNMKHAIFSFGAGPRGCIGRNIAWMQIEKAVVESLRAFEFALAKPQSEWHIKGHWITKQSDMDMLVKIL